MKRLMSITVGIALSTIPVQDVAAQWNVARYGTDHNRVYATFGLDPAFVTSLGYAHVIPVSGHGFELAGDVGVATAQFDARDFRARLGVQTSLLHWRSLHLTMQATAVGRGTENVIYRGFNFGADITGAAGVYRTGWFVAGEFGKDKSVITHVTHTDWYRNQYYADAKDGWYLDAGGTFHYGVAGGFALGRTEVIARAGFRRTEDWKEVTPPMYASIGLGFAF
jgi:hypothetical protein